MTLAGLPPLLREEPALTELLGSRSGVLAVPEAGRAFVLAGLATLSSRSPLLVATSTGTDAERIAHDLAAFLGPEKVETFPAWETLPFERVSPGAETMGRRLSVLWRVAGGGEPPAVIVSPVRALLQLIPDDAERRQPVALAVGQQWDPDELVRRLVLDGYRREYQVEHRGEVARRGSIVDVFPAAASTPLRVDFWGDEIDRITVFDVADQRSLHDEPLAAIFGCREVLPTEQVRARAAELVGEQPWGRAQWERLAEGSFFDGMESWLPWLVSRQRLLPDLLGRGAQVVLLEPRRMRDRASELIDEEASLATTLATTWGADAGDGLARLHAPYDRLLAATEAPVWSMPAAAEGPETLSAGITGWDPIVGDPGRLASHLNELVTKGFAIVVCAEGEGSAARIRTVLAEEGVSVAAGGTAGGRRPGVSVVVEPLERGFVLAPARLAVLAESDVTGRRRAHRRARPRARAVEGFFDSLQAGDYVVHHVHGVGRYAGMVRRAVGGAERDYLLLEYRGGDKLYVPSDQIDAITPYTGGETPSLHRLGGSDFARAKARVRKAVGEIAQELVDLYRRRRAAEGHAFSPDGPWQSEMEGAFPYSETPDQLRAIAEVKSDMEQPAPMDRLVCGDVGFGKTEVAIRAAFKAVQDGLQAAVLVPTTLLAQQHFQTFSDRFAGYPMRVEVLSRFLTPAQARPVLAGMADGSVDVVIGTHRLLSADVSFKRLGLLVVDEEQRFGVTHKEAIKALSVRVDVLTLTATPIPRTLEMSLTGIRDLTLLETPPAERQPILTYVGEQDERAVAEAIRRELLREGQVFYVHNRVADIERVAAQLREQVGEARIAVAHGQMDEGSLEKVVLDFWEGAYDVLVCTTIIESGIDMPTVNTLVVDRADALGLGQLHQLRGRVGRAGMRAYAYLFYPPERALSEEAYERLRTIGEHTELGSGFKIAMRDLEIRGAGNLLGADQSGHIAAVGYDLYVRLVSEAIAELRGEALREPAEIRLELPVHAHLPADYVEREDLRLEAYRRLAAVTTQEEVDDLGEEWRDRYGPMPEAVESLVSVARLRAECARTGVREVTVTTSGPAARSGQLTARLQPVQLPLSAQVRLQRLYPRAIYKSDVSQLVLPLPGGSDPARALREVLGELLADPRGAGAGAPGAPGEAAASR
ncbi:MAG: transcription-repair coupling factor [Acidimicrobiales bacterium]